VTERAKDTSYELLQHLEHRFLNDYFRAEGLTEDPENRFGCQAEAETLVATIFKFRDTINADDRFVRYKVLVGFESVYMSNSRVCSQNQLNSDSQEISRCHRYLLPRLPGHYH